MPRFDITKTRVFIFLAAFATLIPVITYFNIPVPKVAWAYEVEKLEEGQLETIVDLYSRELRDQRREKLKLKRDQQSILRNGEILSDADIVEEEYLNSDIEEIQEIIEQAKKQLLLRK